jgi:DNA-binding helix-hairpin-helix protein with protein kinase domain
VSEAREAETDWWSEVSAYTGHLDKCQQKVEALRSQYRELQGRYLTQRQQLERNKEALSRRQFLQNCFISDGEIPKIGEGRKQILASYGIDSAFDLEEEVLLSIKGFGPVYVANLMDWKRARIAEFRFDHRTGVPESELKALAQRFRHFQTSLQAEMSQEIVELEKLQRETRVRLAELATRKNHRRDQIAQACANLPAQLEGLTVQARQQLAPISKRIYALVIEHAQAKADLQPLARAGLLARLFRR